LTPRNGPSAPRAGRPSARGWTLDLAVVVGLVGLASLGRWGLGYLFHTNGPFALYFPAVLLCAILRGWRIGAVGAVLSAACAWLLFMPQDAAASHTGAASPGNLVMAGATALTMVVTGGYARTLLTRIERRYHALADTHLYYDALFETMSEGFALCAAIRDRDGKLIDYTIVDMNPALRRMLDVGPEAIGSKLSDAPGDRTDWLELCDGVLKTGQPANVEIHNEATDSWHEIRVTRVTETRMAHLFFDVTERKKAELRQARLFDELNHRVSNNLALVSSVLQMKARAADHEVVRDQLLKADARVQSIAQVHRSLLRGARRDDVEFGAYLEDLCASVEHSLLLDDRTRIEVDAEPAVVALDTAIPLGMIVNELVTNAVKYAYAPMEDGLIRVRFGHEDGEFLLSVGDSGRGLPTEVEGGPGGLGMKLVKSLVAQVKGDLQIRRTPGVTFEIRFPRPAD
jgi:two-component sensor histidine kinase